MSGGPRAAESRHFGIDVPQIPLGYVGGVNGANAVISIK